MEFGVFLDQMNIEYLYNMRAYLPGIDAPMITLEHLVKSGGPQ